MIKGMDEVVRIVDEIKKEFDLRGGLRNIVFVACGGSLAASYPARYMLDAESETLRVTAYNSSEYVCALPKNVGKNTLVICTSTKATAETVEAVHASNAAGAITLGLTGYSDSLTAQAAQYVLVYNSKDEWYVDSSLIHTNSQGTSLKVAFQLLKVYENYAHYDKAMDAFEQLPDIYGAAYQEAKPMAAQFAMEYKDDMVWNVLGSGVAWETVYADAFCFFQEMQTVHCVPTHSGEYFHGAFETTDKNLAILLVKSVGRNRSLDDRAEKFLNLFAGRHYILDAKEYGLGALDENVVDYFNGIILHTLSKQFITALADVRMHPMSYRRYMWKFEY